MFKPYFLITKLNLMKKTELRAKVLLFSVVFFFLGMASSSAQYVPGDEAVILLKAEVTELQANLPGASNQELIDLHLQISYFKFIVEDIQNGAEVGAAIYDNKPFGKAKLLGTMGLATAQNDDPNVKVEIAALVAYVDDLLSD
jgi:hypothetical protein